MSYLTAEERQLVANAAFQYPPGHGHSYLSSVDIRNTWMLNKRYDLESYVRYG